MRRSGSRATARRPGAPAGPGPPRARPIACRPSGRCRRADRRRAPPRWRSRAPPAPQAAREACPPLLAGSDLRGPGSRPPGHRPSDAARVRCARPGCGRARRRPAPRELHRARRRPRRAPARRSPALARGPRHPLLPRRWRAAPAALRGPPGVRSAWREHARSPGAARPSGRERHRLHAAAVPPRRDARGRSQRHAQRQGWLLGRSRRPVRAPPLGRSRGRARCARQPA